MSDIDERLAALSPQQRELLERELRRKGLDATRRQDNAGQAGETGHAEAAGQAGETGRAGHTAEHGDGRGIAASAEPGVEPGARVAAGREVKFSLFFFSDDGGREGGD